jgi:hypothetical protein
MPVGGWGGRAERGLVHHKYDSRLLFGTPRLTPSCVASRVPALQRRQPHAGADGTLAPAPHDCGADLEASLQLAREVRSAAHICCCAPPPPPSFAERVLCAGSDLDTAWALAANRHLADSTAVPVSGDHPRPWRGQLQLAAPAWMRWWWW